MANAAFLAGSCVHCLPTDNRVLEAGVYAWGAIAILGAGVATPVVVAVVAWSRRRRTQVRTT